MKELKYIVSLGCSVNLSLAALEVGFTADYLTDTIYSFDLHNGMYAPVLTVPLGADLVDLHAYSRQILYALGFNDRNLYAIDLETNTYRTVTTAPIGDSMELVYSVGVADDTTAYVVGFVENNIYAVNLADGTSSTVLNLPGNPGLANIALRNSTLAYVTGYVDNNLYEVDLVQNTYRLVTPTPVGFPGVPSLEGLALDGDNLAYVVGNMDGNLYRIDLTTGAFSVVTPTPIAGINLINLALDEGAAYTVNNLGGEIYKIQLSDGSFSVLANISGGVNLTGMTLWPPAIVPITPVSPPYVPPIPPPQIGVMNVHSNNLSFANYLNENAPEDVVSLFSELDSALTSALERAEPTRNGCVTYTSQMSSLALSRLVHDHERQKDFQHRSRQKRGKISSLWDPSELYVDAKDEINPIKTRCCPERSYSGWVAPFGAYSEVEAQSQTPAFTMGLGGIAAAFDFNGVDRSLFGVGAAYLYTHLHEERNMGHGRVEQGLVFFYGTTHAQNWYFDLGLAGGFYRGLSVRKISFPGVNETAKSHPQGWQVAPSLEVGYHRFDLQHCVGAKFGASPFVLVDWVANWEQKLREKGAGELNMGQASRFCSLLHGEAGFRLYETAQWKRGKVVFREKLAYSYQKAFQTGSIQAFLIGSPGHFIVDGLSKAQNLGIVEVSVLLLANRPSVPYIDLWYEGQFGTEFQLQQITAEIGKNF